LSVNLADMLQVWSNDRYRSPLHRVIVHRDRERVSAPFFLYPSYETICEPLTGTLGARAKPRFRPISWARFRDQRSAGDYADYGAEIQIDDYRLD
jgi:isopenicillin N synthase-like dioxygenase